MDQYPELAGPVTSVIDNSNGYIKFSGSKQDASAKITAQGVEYVESNLLDAVNYSPRDLFIEDEKKIVLEKLGD